MKGKCSPRVAALLLASVLVAGGTSLAGAACPPQPAHCDEADHFDVPALSCVSSTPSSITVRACAGASGAPAGITIQWAVYDPALGTCHQAYSDVMCNLSLSGQCPTSNFNLAPGACQDVTVHAGVADDIPGCGASASGPDCGDLECDTEYVFWVFAHNKSGTGRSCFSEGVVCRTAPCSGGGDCTLTQGYWKTHGPGDCHKGNNPNAWDLTSIPVGGLLLTDAEACDIFGTNPSACGKGGGSNSGANAVIILEHQLLAALLNKANGAIDCAFANTAIASAQSLLTGYENSCVGASTALGQQMIEVAGDLAAYNSDICACPTSIQRVADPEKATTVKKKSWGKLKTIYR